MAKKVLFITSNIGIEQNELLHPFQYLQSKGIETIHAAIENKEVILVKEDKEPVGSIHANTTLDKVAFEDYDLLVIPGGTVNADTLRINADAKKII